MVLLPISIKQICVICNVNHINTKSIKSPATYIVSVQIDVRLK